MATLKDVYTENGQKSLVDALESARDTITLQRMQKIDSIKTKELEQKLNNIFYGEQSNSVQTWYNQMVNKYMAKSMNTLQNTLDAYDFESNKGNSSYVNKTGRVYATTLQKTANQAMQQHQALQALINSKTLQDSANIKELMAKLENAKEICLQAAREIDTDKISGIFDTDIISTIQEVNAFASFLNDYRYTSNDALGKYFEKALALANVLKDMSSAITDDLVKSVISSVIKGQSSVPRGVSGSGLVSYTIAADKVTDKEDIQSKKFTLSTDGATYTYSYNPSDPKQGKMDIQLQIPEFSNIQGEELRISAKRWSSGSGDFGETSVDAAINRAAGIGVAEAYKYGVLSATDIFKTKTKAGQAIDAAHELAKAAIYTDIVIGLNQEQGYANVAVIDTGSSIEVRSLFDLVAKGLANNSKTKISLRNYNAGTINAEANKIYYSMNGQKSGRSQTYLGLMTSSLNKQKVSIGYNALTS